MEEVWRDISLSSLHHPTTSISATNFCLALHDSSVLDIFSHPSPKGKQRRRVWHSAKESDNDFFACETSRAVSILGLDTRTTNIHHVERSDNPTGVEEPPLHTTDKSQAAFGKAADSFSFSRLDPLNYSSPIELSTLCKKRIPKSDDSTSDHRNKRLMKNRESAARSRARKQAYTTELESKVSRLAEENGRLRRQLGKHCAAATPAQYPKKNTTLQRTLTAPF